MMTSRERVQTALAHREPDRVPVDLGGAVVTGIHASALHRLRQALGLPQDTVKVYEPMMMLRLVDDAVRQITTHPSLHHHPFYYLPCMDDAMARLVFVSHRTGRPEVWCELRASGELQKLTDQPDIGEWSVHPSHDGRFVYYTAGQGAWRVTTDTGKSECLLDFGGLAGREVGMVGAAMGTSSLSHDDRFWALPVRLGAKYHLISLDTTTWTQETILEAETIGHPEFHPSDSSLVRYAGSHERRIWVINRDSTGNRLVYERKPLAKPGQYEWIVHETWRPGSREIITANWRRGCIGIDIDSGAVRPVCSFNAWHPSISRQGSLMCARTRPSPTSACSSSTRATVLGSPGRCASRKPRTRASTGTPTTVRMTTRTTSRASGQSTRRSTRTRIRPSAPTAGSSFSPPIALDTVRYTKLRSPRSTKERHE